MKKSFKYRLFTNKTQEFKLENVFNLNYSASQDILRRLDKAFQAFFRRIKCGDNPGFPRFKDRDRFDSITFPAYGDGIRLKNGRLYIQNVGSVRIKLHRDIEGTIKTVTIKRQNGWFYTAFSCADAPAVVLPASDKEIGIDVGIKSFAATSDGEIIDNPKYLKQSKDKLTNLQQQHSKKKSKRTHRSLAKLHEKIANQRSDFQHKLSRKIVNTFGFIFVEKLQSSQMLNSFKGLNKFINDAAWTQFFNYLRYKAEWTGRTFIEVDPRGTTQRCSFCGNIVSKDLSVCVHECPFCDLVLGRDINAARNILRCGQRLCISQEAVYFS